MMKIGNQNTATPEFTIYKTGNPDVGYLVELDGVELAWDTSLAEAHKYIKKHCKENTIKAAGVTETFGRNRQLIITPRYGYKTFKGA